MTFRDALLGATILLAATVPPALAEDGGRECGPPLGVLNATQGLISTDGTRDGTAVLAPPSLGEFEPKVALGDGVGLARFNPTALRWELWATKGVPGDAFMVASLPTFSVFSDVDGAVHVRDHVVFGFNDGQHGHRLWTTDGTAAGTTPVLGVVNPSDLTRDAAFLGDGRLVFVSADGLEVTDGTVAGTENLKAFSLGFQPNQNGVMATIGNVVLFGAVSGDSGVIGGINQIWRSDGTPAGTFPIFNLAGDAADDGAPMFASFGQRALIAFNGAVALTEGTADRTAILSGISNASIEKTVVVDGRAIFPAQEGLILNDGRLAGTRVLKAAGSGSTVFVPVPAATNMAVLEDQVIFPAAEGTVISGLTHIGAINQLWRTDGTAEGTKKIADLPAHDSFSQILGLLTVGERVLISYSDNGNNVVLSTDGHSITHVLDHADADVAAGRVIECSPARGE